MFEELKKKLDEASELLKDYTRFIDLFKDKPVGDLTRLAKTVSEIKTLVGMNELSDVVGPSNSVFEKGLFCQPGALVKIRPCGDEYKNKTYLGFLLGDVATNISFVVKDNEINLSFSGHNPGIFIPELRKVVFGYESWWGEIEDEKEFSEISDSDIQKVWYVQLWKRHEVCK
jgi:hypothetical protein